VTERDKNWNLLHVLATELSDTQRRVKNVFPSVDYCFMRNLKLYLSVLLLLVLSAALPQALSQTPAPTEQLQVSGDFDLAGVKTGMSAAQTMFHPTTANKQLVLAR